jgi:hypothetical protein
MMGAKKTIFCSPHPLGICTKLSRFCRAVPMMSPGIQKEKESRGWLREEGILSVINYHSFIAIY